MKGINIANNRLSRMGNDSHVNDERMTVILRRMQYFNALWLFDFTCFFRLFYRLFFSHFCFFPTGCLLVPKLIHITCTCVHD